MKKNIKIILLIAFIILLICIYIPCIYASDVNMNLSSENDSTIYGSAQTNTTPTQTSSPVVSDSVEDTLNTLTIADMINIVLCAIGIILVLLGIAIIIRQKAA